FLYSLMIKNHTTIAMTAIALALAIVLIVGTVNVIPAVYAKGKHHHTNTSINDGTTPQPASQQTPVGQSSTATPVSAAGLQPPQQQLQQQQQPQAPFSNTGLQPPQQPQAPLSAAATPQQQQQAPMSSTGLGAQQPQQQPQQQLQQQ